MNIQDLYRKGAKHLPEKAVSSHNESIYNQQLKQGALVKNDFVQQAEKQIDKSLPESIEGIFGASHKLPFLLERGDPYFTAVVNEEIKDRIKGTFDTIEMLKSYKKQLQEMCISEQEVNQTLLRLNESLKNHSNQNNQVDVDEKSKNRELLLVYRDSRMSISLTMPLKYLKS